MGKKVKALKAESNITKLRNKYSAGLASTILLPKEELLYIPSRALGINDQIGGGLVYGRIMELIGWESTGKSLLAMDFGYGAQALGGIVIWVDGEGTFTGYWAEQNGLNLQQLEILQDNAIEPMSDYIRDMIIYYRSILVNNEPILVVVDSIAALECQDNIDSDQANGKAEMGNRAKAIYRFYRKRNKFFEKYGAGVIVVNQVRDKVGASLFEASETTPGGAATKFYASIRMMLIRSKQIKYGKGTMEKKIGQNVITQVTKNKIAPPKASLRTHVHFLDDAQGYLGFSRYAGLSDIFQREGLVKRKGSNYYFKGEIVAKSEEKFLAEIATNDVLRKKLIKRSSIMTISKMQEKLNAISKNLYPVKLKKEDNEA